MTQFASTLYPQTNQTNPVLLGYRDHVEFTQTINLRPVSPGEWVHVMESAYRAGARDWAQAHVDHARRVLTRLANLSG